MLYKNSILLLSPLQLLSHVTDQAKPLFLNLKLILFGQALMPTPVKTDIIATYLFDYDELEISFLL